MARGKGTSKAGAPRPKPPPASPVPGEAETFAAENIPSDEEDDDVGQMPPGGNPYDDAGGQAPVSAPVPGSIIPRLNVASVKAHALEFGYHVRRRPWEAGNVHAPLTVSRNPADGALRPVKALWQSNAYIDSKIVRPGPFSFRLQWPDADGVVDADDNTFRLDRGYDPPLFPLFYTEEGYVYVPKRVVWRNDRIAVLKYVEFWGWNWEPTRSPPREVVYKANLKAGIHARQYGADGDDDPEPPPQQREDLGIDWSHAFREELKIQELLNMTGSAHFSKMIGFPAHSDSGFFAECDEWQRAGQERVERLLGKTGKWSTYSILKMFECLAKACAVMAWGSEYPDFPVEGWNQIVHLGLGQPNVEINMTRDHGHTCGGEICYKISDFSGAIRWPAGDIVNNPWEDLDKPGVNKFRAIEMKRELALKEHHSKGDSTYAPELAQALVQNGDKGADPNIKGNYGWWTNVCAIGHIVGGTYYRSMSDADKNNAFAFHRDIVVPDASLGVTDEASLKALTHLEQEAYWRRHANRNSDPRGRMYWLIERCTAPNPRDRITIPELLLEITKGLSEADESRRKEPAPPLHWEEDGQRVLISRCHDRIRRLTTSNLYSRKEIGLRLHSAVYKEMQGLAQGKDVPPDNLRGLEVEGRFAIRLDDRQKWDEVVRRLFVDAHGKPAAEKLRWEIRTREVSAEPSEDDPDEVEHSDHEIDCVHGTQVTGEKKLERFSGRLGKWDISWYTG